MKKTKQENQLPLTKFCRWIKNVKVVVEATSIEDANKQFKLLEK